jgi:hypothetical protein
MTASRQYRSWDYYGHPDDYFAAIGSGYPPLVAAASGTVAGTVVNPGTGDPTGTTSAILGTDMFGSLVMTPAGTQSAAGIRSIFFNQPIPALRPVSAALYVVSSGDQANASLNWNITLAALRFSVDNPLIAGTPYLLCWSIT